MISRRTLVGAAGLTLGMPLVGRAQQPAVTYKFANNVPATHPLNVRAAQAADAIKTRTAGRFAIDIFPNNQLGSDTDTLSQLRSGGVEFFTLSGLILATLLPVASIGNTGFAFPDHAAVWRAMDGPLGAYVRKQIGTVSFMAMDKVWDNGFRQVTTATKTINTPDDLRGMKLRVPPAPILVSIFRAFGAAPASINFNELYSSLQTGIVEGQENPLALISISKLYEVQKHCALTNHMWDGFWFLGNRRAWDRLAPDVQAIVAEEMNAAAVLQREDMAKLNVGIQTELTGKGMMFNQPDVALFREKLRQANFYGEWKAKFGDEAWALLELTTGKLA